MKVVLDTNCLLQIVFPRCFHDRQFADDVIELLVSLPNVEHVNPAYRFNLITSDPDDNKFVDCAITAGATYIVSNDHHFAELEHYDFPKVDVLTLAKFLYVVRKNFF